VRNEFPPVTSRAVSRQTGEAEGAPRAPPWSAARKVGQFYFGDWSEPLNRTANSGVRSALTTTPSI
jgi:hypothetical protein